MCLVGHNTPPAVNLLAPSCHFITPCLCTQRRTCHPLPSAPVCIRETVKETRSKEPHRSQKPTTGMLQSHANHTRRAISVTTSFSTDSPCLHVQTAHCSSTTLSVVDTHTQILHSNLPYKSQNLTQVRNLSIKSCIVTTCLSLRAYAQAL
jgi:hypothetical protein